MKQQYYVSVSKFVFIMVVMVISGQYFGWNMGIDANSVNSYICAVLLLIVFFSIFIFGCSILTSYFMDEDKSMTELVGEALGSKAGFFASIMCYLEYWFATPAIAIAFAVYIKGFFPELSKYTAILISFAIVFAANIGNLKYVAKIETIATIVALFGIACFYYVGFSNLSAVGHDMVEQTSMTLGSFGKAISFGIWLFLGIEGGITLMHAMKSPSKVGRKGILIGLMILSLLAIFTSLIFIKLAPSSMLLDPDPLPSFAAYFGNTFIYSILVFTGLIGIMASLNGLTIGYIQQHKMLAKSYGYSDSRLVTFYIPLAVALICSLSNDLSQGFVILSVYCAILVYGMVWVSVIKISYSLKKWKMFAFYTLTLHIMIFVGACTYFYGALSTSVQLFNTEILTAYLLMFFVLIAIIVSFFFTRCKKD